VAVSSFDYEPSLLGGSTYFSRRKVGRIDVASVLSLMIWLLCLLPVPLIVPNMTGFGRPATIVGMGLAAWWFLARWSPGMSMRGPQPMRWAALAYLVAMMASYASAYLRGLPALEASGADRSLISTIAIMGVIVMTADGISNRERLDKVLRTFVWGAAVMAVIGMMQFFLKLDVTQYIVIPGLQDKGALIGFEARGNIGAVRVASTASHYIEFSAVMAIALPFAIHFVRFAESRRTRQYFGIAALLIAAAIPLTLSRTGILAATIILVAMLPAWTWRIRYNVLLLTVGLISMFVVIRPGLIGTLASLFAGIFNGQDMSVKGRTDDYTFVYSYFTERPWLGRGIGTFIPTIYRFLDNQWFGTLVEAGLIGLIALASLQITAIVLARIAQKRSTSEVDRHLCAALMSTQVAIAVCAYTFDSLGFNTFATMMMVLIGVCGTMWRLTNANQQVRTAAVTAQTEATANA
jgi:O-antigen ligase